MSAPARRLVLALATMLAIPLAILGAAGWCAEAPYATWRPFLASTILGVVLFTTFLALDKGDHPK